MADLILVGGGAKPQIDILELDETMPSVGHTTRYAIVEIYAAIEAHRSACVFVNTRMQAELLFQDFGGSTIPACRSGCIMARSTPLQRRKVEAAMAEGSLRAVVATSTLDLGIDWGDVDLVIMSARRRAPAGSSSASAAPITGSMSRRRPSSCPAIASRCSNAAPPSMRPKQASRMSPSRVREHSTCWRSICSAQHAPATSTPTALYDEVVSAAPYARSRASASTACSASLRRWLRAETYERYAKLKAAPDGKLRIAHPRFVQAYRMNAGTIVAAPLIKVRLVGRRVAASRKALAGGRVMGEVDEYFIEQLRPGDAFVLAGEVLRFEGMGENEAFVTRATARDPIIPSYDSGKFPLSTHLAERVRAMLADDHEWSRLPPSGAPIGSSCSSSARSFPAATRC